MSFLQHLLNTKQTKYSTFNSHRAALSLLSGNQLSEDKRLTRFMKGISKLRPSRPKYNLTWNPDNVLNLVKGWDNSHISLKLLSLKLVTLLALTTGHRIQTLALIRLSNIIEDADGIQILIPDRIKTSAINRVQPCLQIPFYNNNPTVCVGRTLKCYLEATQSTRPQNEDFLFTTHKAPFKRASKQSLSRWVKQTLNMAGINTDIFKPHTTRHASTSAALKQGVPIQSIMNTAGWTQESTFARFYKRPTEGKKTEFAKAILDLT